MPINPNISVTLPNDGDSGWGDTLNTAINAIVTGVNDISIPSTSADLGAGVSVAAVQTSSFTAAPNYYYPVNAAGGAITVSLPTSASPGSVVTVEREDTTTNTLTVSGQIRNGTTSSMGLTTGQYEALTMVSDSSGYWWPSSGHKTKTWLDSAYAKTKVAPGSTGGSVGSGSQVPVITYNSDGQITAVTTAAVTGSGGAANATTSAPGLVQLAGDLGGPSTSATAPQLKNTGTAGTYGSATSVPTITTDAQGRVTAVSTNAPLDSTKLAKANNLSDLGSTASALTNLGLNNVNNTSDASKPVSAATTAAIALNTFSVTPAIGNIALPPGFISSANQSLTSGSLYMYPFYLGSNGYTVDAMYININTAQSGGTVSFQAALYGDDGTGWINGANQVIAPQSFTLTATGNVSSATLGTPVALTPGRYWMVTLYTNTSTPTTVPVFACLNNTIWSLPIRTSTTLGSVVRGFSQSTSTFPTATVSRTGTFVESGVSNIPLVGLHRSA